MDWVGILYRTGILYGILFLLGMTLAVIISTMQCNKQDAANAAKEGAIWAVFPIVPYILTQLSDWFLSIYTEGWRSIFGLIGKGADEQSYKYIGTATVMVLGVIIGTARMAYTVQAATCKPSVGELATFQANLMAKLKEKEKDKPAA